MCVCSGRYADSVADSGISVLSICTHLSRKSLTSGISDAGRVSGLTHFAIAGVRGCVPASITSFVTSVDRRERKREAENKSRMMKLRVE